MAEFTEVMKQAARMCEAHDTCARCALYGANSSRMGCAFDYLRSTNFSEIERRIGAWAAKHPEQEHPEPEHDGCDGCKYDYAGCNDEPCKRCRYNIGESAPDLWEVG